MKKALLLALIAVVGLFSVVHTAGAQSAIIDADQIRTRLQFKTEADVETARTRESAACANVTDQVKRNDCYTRVKTNFDAARNFVRGTQKDADVKVLRDSYTRGEWSEGLKMRTAAQEANAQETKDVTTKTRAKFSERIEVGIRNHVENNIKRFEAFYNRLVKIADRINSRIEKLDSAGEDVSTAQRYMVQAREDLADAKTAITDLQTAWTAMMSSETNATVDNSEFEKCREATGGIILKTFPARCQINGRTFVDLSVSVKGEVQTEQKTDLTLFAKIRTLAKTAKEKLQSAHKNMIEAVKSLPRPEGVRAGTNAEVEIAN